MAVARITALLLRGWKRQVFARRYAEHTSLMARAASQRRPERWSFYNAGYYLPEKREHQ